MFLTSSGTITWYRIFLSFLLPRLLIRVLPLCWICFGESKRLISPTSAMNPAIVMLPTLLMANNFSTYDTLRIISSSTFLMASNCEVHNRCSSSSIYNSLFVSIFPLSPTLLCATSTRALLYLFLLINAPNVCIEINALIITTGAPIHSAMTLVLYLPIKSHEKV